MSLSNQMNFDKIKNVYIIGIEGAGTSALACILKAQGKNVLGSDEGDHFYYNSLKKAGIKVFHKFTKDNLEKKLAGKIDLVIYSTAIQLKKNPELKYAQKLAKKDNFKIINYPKALALIFNQAKFGIAVCGTHGKTTTTAMLATVLAKAGVMVTALVGAKVVEWKKNALIKQRGKTSLFVIEADEYQNKLQYYKPRAVILTSADYDHPDFFKTKEKYLQVFKDFVAKIPQDGFLVAYAGDKNVVKISQSAQCEVIFYDEIGAKNILLENDFCSGNKCQGKIFGCCPVIRKSREKIRIFGKHNLLNATAVFKVAQKLKLKEDLVKKTLQEFKGTVRRFEFKGYYKGAIIIDDYAHHPVEIKATLQAVRERYPNKIIKCLFHPHTFSRTKALLKDFAGSFADADEIYLLDIYGSAREKRGDISSDNLLTKIQKNNENKITKNLHSIVKAIKYFKNTLDKKDVLITVGAGDVYLVGDELKKIDNKLVSK